MDITFFAAMENCRNITSLGRSTAKIESFVKLILRLRDYAKDHRLSELLRQVIIQTDYEAYLRDLDDEDGEDRISNVDELIMMPIYPAREQRIPGVSSSMVLHKVKSLSKYLCSADQVLELVPVLFPDVVVTMGAGDIDRLVPRLEEVLAKEA
jgi:UDP-N-acetylmuramate-alanine ligase